MERDGVTVLLAVFNGGRHLESAVVSILAQTHQNFELLVIDDGSTDGSGEWLCTLSDARVRVVRQTNQGLVAALNRGLAEARTEFVARMDADDLSAPDRLERQVTHLLDHPEVAAVGCCYSVVDDRGAPAGAVHVAAEPAYLQRRLYFRNTFAHGSMMFRRSAVVEAGGYRDVGPVEDYDLWVRLSARHDLAALPDVLFTYRLTGSGISARERQAQLTGLAWVRDALHHARPLQVPSTHELVAEGASHHRSLSSRCGDPLATYVFDHSWLAVLAARRGRVGTAARLALAVLLLVVHHPRAASGLPVVGRRGRHPSAGGHV